MKNQAAYKAFQNLFQLNAEPIYVSFQKPQQDPLADVREQGSIVKKSSCPTVFNALANIQQNGVIKINRGLFTENVQIRTPGVRLQTNEPGSNTVLVSQQHPTIIIDLPNKEDKIYLESLHFAHLCEYSKEVIRWPSLKELKDHHYRGLKISENMNTSILLKKGTLQIDQCKFSFAGLKDHSKLYSVITVEQQGSLIISRSQILGGQGSIGVYCDGGKINIRQSHIKDHGGVGLLVVGNKDTSMVLKNSFISNCGEGIVLNGPFSTSVENNNINDCASTGITILFGNMANIINNQILGCRHGIEVENSLPKILKNNLLSNKQFGAVIYSKMNGQCKAHIRLNIISQNKRGGLLISGPRNRTEVYNNVINFNQKIGLEVESSAHPHIFLNEIRNNFGHGVHLRCRGTAFLQKNEISGSTGCNLILQGPGNIDNYVYNNKINNARGQGIFLLYCEKFLIAKNQITENYHGILAVTSVSHIEDNRIQENHCNGIMLVHDCDLLVTQNVLQENKKAGIVCRNSSKARLRQNKFSGNKIQILAEEGWTDLGNLEQENQFPETSDIRIPGNLCSLI